MKAFGGIQPLQYISMREFGGLNGDNPFSQNNSNIIAGSGLSLDHFPTIRTRKNFNPVNNALLNNYLATATSMVAYNSNVYVACMGYFKRVDGTTYAGALSNTNEVSFAIFKGNLGSTYLIYSNGTDLKKFNGTTISNLLPGGYPVTVNGYLITTFKNRLFCTSNKTTTILFSALNKADDWATANDAGSITIDEFSDQNITAIFNAGDRLLIFRQNSLFELIGTSPSNFRISLISKEVGTFNNRSVTMLNGIVYFAHSTGIYAYASGSNPQKISKQIDDLRRLDYIYYSGQTLNVVMGTDNQNIYVNTNTQDFYDQTYQYNPTLNQWIGFYESGIKAYAMLNNELYIAYQSVQSGNDVVINKISFRKDDPIYNSDPNYWFFCLPIIDSGTTSGSITLRSISIRYTANSTFNIQLIGTNKTSTFYKDIYELHRTFPGDTTFTYTTLPGNAIFSRNVTTNQSFPNDLTEKIPIKPTIKYNAMSLMFYGLGPFTLHEIAMEIMTTPFNTNDNV